jgi:hypothetical protein
LAGAQDVSVLWGRDGEAWDPAGRLPDVSFAGYACGERPPPKVPVVANVKHFGAKGDGRSDDSAAFLAAIAKTDKGAIAVPAGRYVITRILEIRKPGVVLRGAGPEQSVLVFPTPLNDIEPNWGETTSGLRTSNYSWSGGFIWFKGTNKGSGIGAVSAPAKRGDREVRIAPTSRHPAHGDWIEITVRDDAKKSLLNHLYSGDPGNTSKISPSNHGTSFVTRVVSAKNGLLTIDRPLRIDLRPEWSPQVRHFRPSVTEGGVESLGFEFPKREYRGHFSDLGFNAVAFSGVAHCWARDLQITNADSGIFASGRFCTIDNVRFRLDGSRLAKESGGVFGHHGVSLTGHDNLLTRFEIGQRFIHDITVSGGAGNVTSSGSGIDLCFDHHKRAPYDNVFTDLDLGEGTRMWKCGGGADLGRHCGAHGTFWNIRAKKPQQHPGGFGPPSLNLVAVNTKEKSVTDPTGRWLEAIPPKRIHPANLHEAQWRHRLDAR